MKPPLVWILTITLLAAHHTFAESNDPDDETTGTVRFGMDARSIHLQEEAGAKPDYGVFWIGPWTLKSGWGGPGDAMTRMREAGVTPAIHFYYWGDDISPSCVEDGCWSDLHNAHKDRAGWQRLAEQLVEHLNSTMQGDPVLVFMETEFNQNGIEEHEPFDRYMAEKISFIRDGYPAAETVLSFGNWNRNNWPNFDESAQVSDYIGLQGMRGSTRDSLAGYRSIYQDTLHGVERAQEHFGKPVVILDIALSSYPEPEYLRYQAEALEDFFIGIDPLKAAGVEALVYRAWQDNPKKNTANYYGSAERHWGLEWSSDAELKPAGEVWLAGVQAERSGDPYETPLGEDRGFEVTFDPSDNVNDWWVETHAAGSDPLDRVEARVDGGNWHTLEYTDWGTWAKSFHAPEGSAMTFRAMNGQGDQVSTFPFAWMQEDPRIDDTAERPASARFTVHTDELRISLDASDSRDPYDRDLSFFWDFGDGNTTSGPQTDHTYEKSGDYHVTLTVHNGDLGNSTTQTVPVRAPPPTASFTNTTDGLHVQLDASGSNDPLGRDLTYEWDFGDGNWSTGRQTGHTYGSSGRYPVSLVVHNGEAGDSTSTEIHVQVLPPTARFNSSTNGLEVSLDASGSSDPTGRDLRYTWDLGDGNQTTGRQTGHTYGESGTYPITLTVDNGEHQDVLCQNVTVTTLPPIPRFIASVDHLQATFNASASSDPNGRDLTYTWDLGDGNTSRGPHAGHTYMESGTYPVTLTADNGERTNTTTRNVTVRAPPPTAGFTATTEGLQARFDATDSSDPRGRELTYTWDFGDDGRSTGRQTGHTYEQSGTYPVTLRVDNGEDTHSTMQNVTVETPPPSAAFTTDSDGLRVSFDASPSSDPSDRDLRYAWDFGDGDHATGQNPEHSYAASGTYTVTLTVDNGEKTDRTSEDLQVETHPPVARFDTSLEGLRMRLDASSSTDEYGRDLTYTWDLGDGTRSTGRILEHEYASSGTYAVTLVVNNGEKSDRAVQTVEVEPTQMEGPRPLEAEFRVGDHVNEWWIEVYMDANHPLERLDARVDGGSWRSLSPTDWGSWAKSFHVPRGAQVEFRATDELSQRVLSPTTTWLQDEPPKQNQAPLEADFRLGSNVNKWWVEVYVSANNPIERVQARVDEGPWQELSHKDWGSWAASLHAPEGSVVDFRATDEHTQRTLSARHVWG